MKKFLIFLVSIVVVVCFGLTTYYFMRNDEVIIINTKEIYCNSGDIISLDSLNIEVKKPNKKTTYNYNAGGSEVTDLISYNEANGYYQVSSTAGGEVDLVIGTSNKRYPEFKVKVHIGNGSTESPYYIFNQTDLSKIGSVYRLDSNYSLMANIALTNDFKPIGYSLASNSWIGFSGCFNGNGYTISNLNLSGTDYTNAGLFSTINSGATVSNLVISNATISGAYQTVGILAGSVAGNVERVVVTNSNITTTEANAYVGSLAGVFNGQILKLSYADNVSINVTDANAVNATVGGFVGKLVETTATATYANNIVINYTSNGLVGGYAAEFVIGTSLGSIQQSYANTTSAYVDFASFISKVSANANFDASKANMLYHFIGNIAIVSNKATNNDIIDTDLIKDFDNTYFKNETYPNANVFYNKDASMYLVRGYVSAGSVVETNEYVYYAIDTTNKTLWDTDYVWKTSSISMPSLVLGSVEPTGVSGDYFRKDLAKIEITNTTNVFQNIFKTDVQDKQLQILEDVTLTNWTPVALTNCTINGNGKTITLKLENSKDNCLGLFTVIDNCSVENLNIVVTGVSANSHFAGALAGKITSSANTISTIKNVNITYENGFNTVTITEFGGIVANAENTEIDNVSVSGLQINSKAKINTVGSLVAVLTSGSIKNSEVDAKIYGTTNVGGVVGVNNATISNVTANVVVNNVKEKATCLIAGIAANNTGTIVDVVANVEINVLSADEALYAGGVVATNNGSVESVSITGNGVTVVD